MLISGCAQSGGGQNPQCVANETIAIIFDYLFLPVVNVTFGNKYLCTNPRTSNGNRIECEIPNDISWQDLNRTLSVQVRCGNETSIPFAGGIVLYGRLAVTGVTGCRHDEKHVTEWRTSGCEVGDVVTITGNLSSCIACIPLAICSFHFLRNVSLSVDFSLQSSLRFRRFAGSGFYNSQLYILVGGDLCSRQNQTVSTTNISLTCTLSPTPQAHGWVSVRVFSGAASSFAADLVSFAHVTPVIYGIAGGTTSSWFPPYPTCCRRSSFGVPPN